MLIAVLSGETAIFVVDDVHENSGLFFDLLSDVIVIVEDDDQRVLFKVLAF